MAYQSFKLLKPMYTIKKFSFVKSLRNFIIFWYWYLKIIYDKLKRNIFCFSSASLFIYRIQDNYNYAIVFVSEIKMS